MPHTGDAMRDAAGMPRPIRQRQAWGGLGWRWERRIGAPACVEAAARVGRSMPHLDDESLRRAIRDELVRIARTKASRPPAARKLARLRRAVERVDKVERDAARLPPLDDVADIG